MLNYKPCILSCVVGLYTGFDTRSRKFDQFYKLSDKYEIIKIVEQNFVMLKSTNMSFSNDLIRLF